MPEPAAAPLGALEPDRFFGRAAERERFRSLVRDLARGSGRSAVLWAPAGAGKTEFLKQCHGQLFRSGEIFPFYYRFPRISWDLKAFAADFFAHCAAQYRAFRRREPALAAVPPSGDPLRSGLPVGDAGDAVFATTARSLDTLGPEASPALEVSLLPHRLAAATGRRVLCLLDDAAHFAGYVPSSQRAWSGEALGSRIAPAVFACRTLDRLAPILGADGSPEAVTAWHLDRLSDDAAEQLLQHHLRTAGLEMDAAVRARLVEQAGGSPFYLQAMVRALGERRATGLWDMQRAYAAAVCDGELSRHLLGRLMETLPDLGVRRTALELLAYCLREEFEAPEIGLLGGLMFKTRREIEEAVEGLRRAGLVRIDCARIFVAEDPVFRDFVWAFYRREFGRSSPRAVEAALVAEKARGRRATAQLREREALRAALRELLGAWAGQHVPALYFKADAFHDRLGPAPAPEQLAGLAAAGELVSLPEVVSVASGRVGQGSSLATLEIDALAWAFSDAAGDAEVAWVASYLAGGEGSESQVEDFERTVGAMQAAGDLPTSRLVKWAILGALLDAPGARAAARFRMATSTVCQLQALAGAIGVAARFSSPRSEPQPLPSLEFEMTIPMVSDTELVAARALEQLAENLSVRPQEIGRIKMALVEACINAFEHSGVRDGRVHLLFSVAGRELRIRVENRGKALGAQAFETSGPAAGPRQRGWGLSLIRELMDEVAFEPRDDGVTLLMVKHLAGKEAVGG